MDAIRLSRLNVLHSIVIAGISFWEFKETIQATPEIYFSMFLALIALTFSNNMRSGNKSLINAAFLVAVVIACLQWYYAIDIFQSKFAPDKWRKGVILLVNVLFIGTCLQYYYSKK